MFSENSRYKSIDKGTIKISVANGESVEVQFIRRRFIPTADKEPVLLDHTVTQDERPDILAHKYLQDSTMFWKLCDANNIMHPVELTDTEGRRIKITMGDF